MRSGNSSSRHKDEKTSRSWRNTSPDGSWRELETPTARHQDKPGDVKILKKEKNDRGRDDVQGAGASTSSAWRPKSHSPDTAMWRPASASTQASSGGMDDDGDDLHESFRKYLHGYRNKSPDSIYDDGDGEEDLSAEQRQWLMARSTSR
jgi:hypothetical protein